MRGAGRGTGVMGSGTGVVGSGTGRGAGEEGGERHSSPQTGFGIFDRVENGNSLTKHTHARDQKERCASFRLQAFFFSGCSDG